MFSRTELEDPAFETNFDPTAQSAEYLSTLGGGPTGVALDETNARIYVTTRFNNSVEVIDLETGATSFIHALHNPEPASIVDGRRFLYDGVATPGNPHWELVRLALPRRVYTQSHVDYLVEVIQEVWNRRESIGGFRFTYQAPTLRHFTARFEPLYSLTA